MNKKNGITLAAFVMLACCAFQAQGEDIDLYSRIPSPKNNPNVLIILDNSANSDNVAAACNYDAVGAPGSGTGGPSAMGATVFGNEQCALYNVINALPTTLSGGALVNIGIMVYNANNLDKDLGLPGGTCPGGNGGCLIVPMTAMTSANKTALMNFIQGWTKNAISANGEATASAMQEAWAFYAGQVGMSGRNYKPVQPPASCVNNYVVFLGNAYNNAGSPGDPGTPSVSGALSGPAPSSPNGIVAAYAWAQAQYTAAGGTATGMPPPPGYPGPINIPAGTYGAPPANNSCGSYSMPNHTDPSGLYADEWARFMHTTNLYYKPMGNNTITTYSIAVIGPSCKPDYPALLNSMATHGGGKYFPASGAADIFQYLLRVINEVQAVNSVFSASSLPVSVNTQGTYLNQIYIGMFRPDPGGRPRWYGNLKQYQFIYNPTTKALALGDAAGLPAISAAGTGFLDPSIASFWTCTNASHSVWAGTLLGPAYGTLPQCASDPAAGFWANNVNGIGGAFDLPDGDVVEKGGHAQMLRLANLSDNYASAPGSTTNPRKLYTYCPSGAACKAALSDPANVFDTSNLAITDAMLGTGPAPNTTRDTLLRWVRGEDNLGDEPSLCPPGSTPGAGTCPNPAVNIRPSVHGDVLHSRPVVLNYGGTLVNILSTSDAGGVRTATASATDIATLAALGGVVPVTFGTGQACAVTVNTASNTFTYPTTNCGVPGPQTVAAGANDIVIFYGGNDGVFRAIDGNPPTYTFIDANSGTRTTLVDPKAGQELWGFVPAEFLGKLKRLRDNSPLLQMPTTPAGIVPAPQRKDYFADGATGVYQTVDGNGKTARAVLYITMRRGGRFLYAVDVTDHSNPQILWKHGSADAGFAELGQTWSMPKVARIRGWPNPVVIFGAGYSASEDNEAPTADTMGRGIFVLDAFSGSLVWSACSAGCTLTVPGMAYSIPADLTLLDRNRDGYIDRVYATDVGGNVWRLDLEPAAGNTPANWQVNQLAALGCNGGACPAGTTPRKFLYPVEVITTPRIDFVFVASGDREHPLYTDPNSTASSPSPYLSSPPYGVSAYAVTNRAYMLKDTKTGMDGSGQPLITEASLVDCTGCSAAAPYDGTLSGYYITPAPGEKSVNAPLVVAGFIYFGTNQAQVPNPNRCEEGLGEATGYRLSPFTGTLVSGEFENGGLPPSPVAGVVNIVDPVTGKTHQVPFCLGCGGQEDNNNTTNQGANCTGESALAGCRPVINVRSSRTRPYWYRENK